MDRKSPAYEALGNRLLQDEQPCERGEGVVARAKFPLGRDRVVPAERRLTFVSDGLDHGIDRVAL